MEMTAISLYVYSGDPEHEYLLKSLGKKLINIMEVKYDDVRRY